jgi:hypothetical protein
MKKFAPIYYLLFVMLIMGAFASMAQNAYGIKMIGFVAIAFTLVFSWQLLFDKKNQGGSSDRVEVVSLIIMSIILAMRVFYIRFAYVELIFALAALALIIVYAYKVIALFRRQSNASPVWTTVLFYASVIIYLISIAMMPFSARLGNAAGEAGFAVLILFLIVAAGARDTSVIRLSDRSFILISLFVLFTAYAALTRFNALPPMYDTEFPNAYYQLINDAERGDVKLYDGKPKHEAYKSAYNRFVKRNKK